ncbi:hypothetical protein D9M68_791370 [compost metagenome]
MHQSGRRIHADVGLHAEVPLVAFLGLMHVRIALAFAILGRGRRGDQRGIDDGAFLEQQTPAGQMLVDRFKQRPRQLMGFQQPAESQQRRSIRR